jgi:hypothetical protein
MMPEKAGNVNESPGALSDLSRPGEGGELGGQQAMCGRVIEGGGGETAVITICLLYMNAPTLILLWVEYSSALYQRNFDQSLVLGTDDITVVTFEPGMSAPFPAITRCISILMNSLRSLIKGIYFENKSDKSSSLLNILLSFNSKRILREILRHERCALLCPQSPSPLIHE